MSITRLPEIVFPLAQVNKVNEIVDVLNDNLNMYYSAENPALTPVGGVATWTVTHNLGTENVNCSLYNGDNLVISNVAITSENVITVSFNASTNIPAETYKIVVISNGAGSSSGSGSYVLPTASTTTLGGVRIDGSSITINNGVISSTVDSTLSETSTNPVQNKVISNYVKPAIDNYLPNGTIINIKADGTGDFPTLQDAIDFIDYKWSNGVVTIKLDAGTHTLSSAVTVYCQRFNFPKLHIIGESVSTTFLTGAELDIRDAGTPVMVEDITFYQAGGTVSSENRAIYARLQAVVRLLDCIFDGTYAYFNGSNFGTVGNCSFKNSKYGLGSQAGSVVNLSQDITFNNVDTCFFIRYLGNLALQNPTMTFTNTNIKFRLWDKAYNYNPSAGLCFYSDGDGTIGGKFRAS